MTTLIKITFIFYFALLSVAAHAKHQQSAQCHQPSTSANIPNEVQKTIKERGQFGLLKGIVVGVVDKNGMTYFCYDNSAKPEKTKIDENSLFEIGSISKTFTASLMSLAMLNGEIKGTAPITYYLKRKMTNSALDQITVKSLLNHHAGLHRIPTNFSPKNPLDPYADYLADDLYEYLDTLSHADLNLAQYNYSNTGFGIAGHLLELTSGHSYSQWLSSQLTKPLEMHNTFVGLPTDTTKLAKGHHGDEVPNWNFDVLVGAGGVLSSAKDMLMFLKANMHINSSQISQALFNTHQKSKDNVSSNTDIGLAWFIERQNHGPDIIYHDGNTNGYWTFAGFLADKSKAVIVLSNSGLENINDIGFHLLNSSSPLNKAPAHIEIPLKASELSQFIGSYSNEMGLNFSVSSTNEGLFVALNSQPKLQIYPRSASQFFYRDLRAEISFELIDGKKTLTLLQDGEKYSAIKVE